MINLDIKYINEGLIEDNKTIFFTITNEGYLDYTRNMLESLKKFNCNNQVLIVCLDTFSNNYFKDNGYFTYFINLNITNFSHFGTQDFSKCCYIKLYLIEQFINMNYNIFYTDGDIFFIKNPLDELKQLKTQDVDMLIQNDSIYDNDYSNVCAGFLYVSSNEITKKYFNISNIENTHKYNECMKFNNDQTFINMYIKSYMNTLLFPLCKFPNGNYFYNFSDKIMDSAVMVHFNWVVGHEKQERMKKYGMWVI